MMVFELLYLGMLLVRLAAWFVRLLVRLHVGLILVALPAGMLVRAGAIRDVNSFAVVSCAWALLLLAGWFVVARNRERDRVPAAGAKHRGARGPRVHPSRA